MNQLSDHPTRTLLLDAGLRLVQSISLSRLSVNQIVKEAGVAKGTFYVHFADRDSYLVALHGRFHEDINTVIAAATADIPSGRENLQRGIGAYLDSCLQRHALKALLVEARVAPGVAEAVRQRDQLYYTTVAQNFTAMGWPSAMYTARLFVTMVAEAALMELEQGEVITAVRQILWQFIDSKQPSGNSS